MTRMSSDAIDRIASDTSSYVVDVFGRKSDGKSSSHYPDLGRVLASRRVKNGGKPNTLRPVSIRSVSRERNVGCVGALPFPVGAGSASRPIVPLDRFGREF